MRVIKGAYSLLVMSPRKLIAARDPHGFRPLCMGKYNDSVVFASESAALDACGAKFIRDILYLRVCRDRDNILLQLCIRKFQFRDRAMDILDGFL